MMKFNTIISGLEELCWILFLVLLVVILLVIIGVIIYATYKAIKEDIDKKEV